MTDQTTETRLRLAHQARRAKEHQLDDIRRALCDIGLMEDDDPYSHADLADVIRQNGRTSALDLTEPDVGAAKRAEEYEQERDQAIAVLAEVLATFVHKVPGHRIPRVRSGVDVVTLDKWRSVIQHDVERPWWQQVDTMRAELEQAQAALHRVRAVHQPQPDGTGFPDGQQCTTCSQDGGDGYQYLVPWPCPTARALGEPAPAATQVTDGERCCGKPPGAVCLHDVSVPKQQPREHCGDLMPAWVIGPRSECTLRPGHSGSHADDRGARWWYDPHSEAVGNHTDPSRVVHTTSNTPPVENT